MSRLDLTHNFLIAMPHMADPNFARTVTYVCEHNEQGALGLVINRPMGSTFADLFEQVGIELKSRRLRALPVYFGGPVQQDRGFVLHRPVGEWKSTLAVRDVLGFTTSRDVLEALGAEAAQAPKDVLITLGYAGWAPGQLEHEIAQNAWLSVEADPRVIFGEPPEARYDAAIKLLGFDPGRLLDVAGHA